MSKLQIVIGSTRPTRAADLVTPWVIKHATNHKCFEVEVLDLRDWPLPTFAEHFGTLGDINNPTYSEPLVRAWNHKVRESDAWLVITPEYNHSIPGVLKNAIESLWASFALRNKPLLAVGYSGSIAGGTRAIEHLAHISIEAEMAPLRNNVIIPSVGDAFDQEGKPVNAFADVSLEIALDDLAWWSAALESARNEGELVPGIFRGRAAVEAAADS